MCNPNYAVPLNTACHAPNKNDLRRPHSHDLRGSGVTKSIINVNASDNLTRRLGWLEHWLECTEHSLCPLDVVSVYSCNGERQHYATSHVTRSPLCRIDTRELHDCSIGFFDLPKQLVTLDHEDQATITAIEHITPTQHRPHGVLEQCAEAVAQSRHQQARAIQSRQTLCFHAAVFKFLRDVLHSVFPSLDLASRRIVF